MVSVITMKGNWYYPTPIRLSVAVLCASFLATYSSAADTSTAHHRSPASLTISTSDTGEIRKNQSVHGYMVKICQTADSLCIRNPLAGFI